MTPRRAAIIIRRMRSGRWSGAVVYRDGRVLRPSWFVGTRDELIECLEELL